MMFKFQQKYVRYMSEIFLSLAEKIDVAREDQELQN